MTRYVPWLIPMLFSASISLAAWAQQGDDELDVLFGPAESAPEEDRANSGPPADAAEEAPPPEASTPPVAADAAAPAVPRRRSANRLVEEIVVTAQKREQNIKDVPIAIAAFTPEKLDAFGIESAQDLERITPGLTITNAAGFSIAYLRGVGTDAFLPGADPSVPFYLDGVALLGAQGSSDTLGRIERIEVLKGPQGTLFGRNATGGAISIVTPQPEYEFFGDIKLELGQHNERNLTGFVNVPILDSLAASIAVYNNTRENYYSNDSGPLFDIYSKGGRAKIRWEATDSLTLTLTGTIGEGANNSGLVFENTRPAPILGAVLPADPQADRNVSLDSLSGANTESYLYSAVGEWNAPWLDIKFIASDQELDAPFAGADFDKSALPIVNIESIKQLSTQETLEFQFLSNEGTKWNQRFEWVAGFYYLKSSGGYDPIAFEIAPDAINALGLPLAGPLTNLLDTVLGLIGQEAESGIVAYAGGVLESVSYSGYAQGTLTLRDNFDLTLGLRYQTEDRNLLRSRLSIPGLNGEGETVLRSDDVPELNAEQLSPKVALQWRPGGGDNQIYLGWARAFKSPTYNTVNLLDQPESVEEEQVDSYELGFKSDWLDGALRLNGAVFYTEQENLLTGFVAVASGGVVNYDNAGNAEIKGAEFDFLWTPLPDWNPGLVLTGAATYLDTEYTDYPNGRGYDEATGLAFGDSGTTPLPARDLKGNRIVRTPEWTYTAGINQSIPVRNGSIEIGLDTYYNSGFFFLPQNSDLYARESYNLLNARVSYFYDPWGLQLTAFGENITDTVYNEVVFVDDFGRNQVLNSPPVFGLRGKLEF